MIKKSQKKWSAAGRMVLPKPPPDWFESFTRSLQLGTPSKRKYTSTDCYPLHRPLSGRHVSPSREPQYTTQPRLWPSPPMPPPGPERTHLHQPCTPPSCPGLRPLRTPPPPVSPTWNEETAYTHDVQSRRRLQHNRQPNLRARNDALQAPRPSYYEANRDADADSAPSPQSRWQADEEAAPTAWRETQDPPQSTLGPEQRDVGQQSIYFHHWQPPDQPAEQTEHADPYPPHGHSSRRAASDHPSDISSPLGSNSLAGSTHRRRRQRLRELEESWLLSGSQKSKQKPGGGSRH
jgi:hypothetical protein